MEIRRPHGRCLRSTFQVETELKEEGKGRAKEPLLALYPHQWRSAATPLFLPGSYASPRGEMKLVKGPCFTTEMRFNGVLPVLPNVAPQRHAAIANFS